MSLVTFFRSEPVRLGIKAGFLGAVISRYVISAGVHDHQSPLDCAGMVVIAGGIRVGLCSLADCHPAADIARIFGMA